MSDPDPHLNEPASNRPIVAGDSPYDAPYRRGGGEPGQARGRSGAGPDGGDWNGDSRDGGSRHGSDRDGSGRDHGGPDRGNDGVAGAAGGMRAAGSGGGRRPADDGWERDLIAELAREGLVERRRGRRWRIASRLLGLVLLIGAAVLGYAWFSGTFESDRGTHTALIDIEGVIEAGGRVQADDVVSALQSAFGDRNTAGIVLRINSPGGSPVQAGIIHDEIRRLRQRHPTIAVHAVVEDVCASGGYYIAAAADRIYVNQASLIGSIGVVMSGFGFTGLIDKVGVERRLLTAGSNKGFLDSFSPVSPEQQAHAQAMLDEIHRQFIAVVRAGRGDRLRETPEMFSGLVWTGERGIELGLADALGTVDSVAREVIKAGRVVDFSYRESLADRLSRRFGAAAAEALGARVDAPGGGLRLR